MNASPSQIGLIGLAVMGQNLARNIASKKFRVSVFNRTANVTEQFIRQYPQENMVACATLKALVQSLQRPRKILIMVKAGEAVDEVLKSLTPLLDSGDVVADCGNSFYRDTIRREAQLRENGILFIGCGISGGEEGALRGPSIMPGGEKRGYELLKPVLSAIAAKDFDGFPCVAYLGPDGSGHYVKMVHNGIEYAIMQLMAESYDMLRKIYRLPAPAIADIFARFNEKTLHSYLFEIAVHVLRQADDQGRGWLIDKILDSAGQKGTGRWVVIDALERGLPLPAITAAVFARSLSALRTERTDVVARSVFAPRRSAVPLTRFQQMLERGLYASIIATNAEGYALLQCASREQRWRLDLAEITRLWQGGCIIRADVLTTIRAALRATRQPETPLLALPAISAIIKRAAPAWRELTALGLQSGVALPALSASLSYVQTLAAKKTSANFIQGLRDYFGAHTYERTDRAGTFHTQWQ